MKIYKSKTTLEQLSKEARVVKETKEQMLKEMEELRPFLNKAKEAKEELQKIQRDYPTLAPIEIARKEAKSVFDEEYYINKEGNINLEMFGLAIDAMAQTLRSYPMLTYLIWPENIPRESYELVSRMNGGVAIVLQYSERSRAVLMQYALPYYRNMLVNRITNKTIDGN
jgi:hypothetical protein